MSDQKKNHKDDIVAKAEDAPETISDDALEDAEGGWSWGVTQPTFKAPTRVSIAGSNFETVYGGVGNDDVMESPGLDRINPKNMPDPYGF